MNQSHSPIQPVLRALMTRPHKSIPSPRSSQCHVPHGSPPQINSIAPIQLCAPMLYPHKSISSFTSSQCRTPMACPPKINPISLIQSRPHDVSQPVSHPNGVPPQISPIQSCAPMTYPINQFHRTDPTRVACPTAHPHKSIPSPWSSQCGVPPWKAPLNQSHHPVPASATHRHKSTPLPHSSQCRVSPWNDSIAPIQPVSHIPMIQSHRPDPASDVSPHGTPPQIYSIAPIQSGAPMTRPCKSTPSPWYSQCRMPPWHTS